MASPLTIDDISKPLGECVEGLFKHLGFTTASYCLLHNGTLCEYERSPEAIGLADGVELELSDEWPQWHWRAHAPSAGPPTSAVFSPLLSAGGGWSFAALVATVCTAWRDEVRARGVRRSPPFPASSRVTASCASSPPAAHAYAASSLTGSTGRGPSSPRLP